MVRSGAGPTGRALLLERERTLARVARLAHRHRDRPLPLELLGRRPVARLDQYPLRRRYGEWAVSRDGAGQIDGCLERRARGDEPVDEAYPRRLSRADEFTGQRPLHSEVEGRAAGEPHQPATGRDETALRLGESEPRVLGGHHEIAGEHDLEATGEGGALDSGDRRFRRWLLDDAGDPASADRRLLAGEEGLEVHARAEGSAGSGDDRREQRRVG